MRDTLRLKIGNFSTVSKLSAFYVEFQVEWKELKEFFIKAEAIIQSEDWSNNSGTVLCLEEKVLKQADIIRSDIEQKNALFFS